MITIRAAQMAVLAQAARSNFEQNLAAQLKLPPAEIKPQVEAALAQGLSAESDVAQFVEKSLRARMPPGTETPAANLEGFSKGAVGGTVEPCPLPLRVHWIDIELVGEDDHPIPGEQFRIVLPDGSEVTGSLSEAGKARVKNIADAGNCRISFPNLDREAWEPITA